VVVTSSVRARSHGDDPSRLGHLIIDYRSEMISEVERRERREKVKNTFTKSGSHLVGESSSDDHDIRL